jgi:hypothetical protein
MATLTAAQASFAADPLFESLDPIHLRLHAPLHAMARDREKQPAERPGTLTLLDAQGVEQTALDIKVRPRGNSRRDREVCRFPPLRVNFAKKDVKGTVFAGQDKLKLVTHCRPQERHESFVYKEFLVYRMLNQVTETGFRVRPLLVDYVDSERAGEEQQRFAFFIEDKKRLARRLDVSVADVVSVDRKLLEPRQATLMDLFQFMIGNTDYSFLAGPEGEGCCHNAVPLIDDDGRYLPVPYDFDITGFVDPPYAVVDYQLPIKKVRTRLYRGICRDAATQQQAVAHFLAARASILDTLRTETALDERSRGQAIGYVEEFFAILDDPKRFDRQVGGACRG